MSKQRVSEFKIAEEDRPAAMCIPAQRMVMVSVWVHLEDDPTIMAVTGDGLAVYPILAIRTYHEDKSDFLIYDRHKTEGEDCDLMTHRLLDCSNEANEAVVCDWPSSEDDSRLQEVIARLRARATEKAKEQKAKQQAARLLAEASR